MNELECQQIEKMLDYQAVDKQYTDLNENLRNSEVAVKYSQYQGERKRAIEEVARINTITEDLYKQFDVIAEQYKDVQNQIEEISSCLDNDADNSDGIDYYVKQLEKYDSKINELQNQVDQLMNDLRKKGYEYKAEMENANKAAQLEKKYQSLFVELRDKNMETAKNLQSQLKTLKAAITDEDLFKAYQEAKKRGIKRVLVPYRQSAELHVCGGCGVEVNVNVREKFESGAVRV